MNILGPKSLKIEGTSTVLIVSLTKRSYGVIVWYATSTPPSSQPMSMSLFWFASLFVLNALAVARNSS